MRFSERTNWPLGESAWAAAASAARRDPRTIDLTETNPTRCGFRFFGKTLRPFSDKKNLTYEPDPLGLAAARTAVAGYYRDRAGKISPDDVLLTAGTSEAYSFLLKLFVNPGQVVLVPEPGYPLLDHIAQLSDAKLVRYPLVYDDSKGWSIDRAAFEKVLSVDVRLIVVVHPNNPTGHRTSDEERAWLEKQAVKRGAALVSDEVFLDFSFDSREEARSFASNEAALTFTLSGVSKILALPQMKLSWIAASGPEAEVREAMARLTVIADAYLTVAAPPQNALAVWLDDRHLEEVHDTINARLSKNRQTLEKTLSKSKAGVLKADGGWQAVLRFDRSETDEEVSLKLMGKGVLVQPGYLFDLPEHHLVVSLLPEPSVFAEGVRRLADLV